jgi:DNA-directed RNA polymerase beta subunit
LSAQFKHSKIKNADRKFFTGHMEQQPLPDLIELQKSSYDWFLKSGIKELFEEVSPITDFTGRDLELLGVAELRKAEQVLQIATGRCI